MPQFTLANNLWIGNVPTELTGLTVPEQLLIAHHYPRCYIFKLFPCDMDTHVLFDQLHTAMGGNACLFELNTQEVVMLKGQHMPSPVQTLASVIAITFIGSKKLPADWLKKTFQVRQQVVFDALLWLHHHNPIYADIVIDEKCLQELPEDDELVERERESYLSQVNGSERDDGERLNELMNGEEDGE